MSHITPATKSKADYSAVLRSTAAKPGFEDLHDQLILQLSFSDTRTQVDICNKLVQKNLLAFTHSRKLNPESIQKSDLDKKNFFIFVYLKKETIRNLCSSKLIQPHVTCGINPAGIANKTGEKKLPVTLANQFKRIKLTANDREEGQFLCQWVTSLIQEQEQEDINLNTDNYKITARSAEPNTVTDGEESTQSLPRTLILEVKSTTLKTNLSLKSLLDKMQFTTRCMKLTTSKGCSRENHYLLIYINPEKLLELQHSDQRKKQPVL